MSVGGQGPGGVAITGPTRTYDALPMAGYREILARDGLAWFAQFIDGLGTSLDLANVLYITTAARAAMLDLTAEDVASTSTLASQNEAPTEAIVRDTMLDLLAYAVGIPFPLDPQISQAQKRELARIGYQAVLRKGIRAGVLSLVAALTGGVVEGWRTPDGGLNIILPDGAPSPGGKRAVDGGWVPAAGDSAVIRPWIFSAVAQLVRHVTGATSLGIGYSQFRAGFSAAGEPVFDSGTTINLFRNEHFTAWSSGLPGSWVCAGDTTTISENNGTSNDASPNFEFTDNSLLIDLAGKAAGVETTLLQNVVVNITNVITHRLEIDYSYTNAQEVDRLEVLITDENRDGTTYYWDASTSTWLDVETSNPIPACAYPATAPVTRARFACDIVPQRASNEENLSGTKTLGVMLRVVSDGTATSQVKYLVYRVGLYEKFDAASEHSDAVGNRSLYLPLIDGPGNIEVMTSGTSTGYTAEVNSARRDSFKIVNPLDADHGIFAYHPAISGRSFRCNRLWTNYVLESDLIDSASAAAWTFTNCLYTQNQTEGPDLDYPLVQAGSIVASATGATVSQAGIASITLTGKSFLGGIWAKRLSANDATYSYVKLELVDSAAVVVSSAIHSLSIADGWKLLTLPIGAITGSPSSLTFRVRYFVNADASASSGSGASISLRDGWVYETGGNTDLRYPPYVKSSASEGVLEGMGARVRTSVTGSNVLERNTLRPFIALSRGLLQMRVVPTIGAPAAASTALFVASSSSLTQDRLTIYVTPTHLKAALIEDTSGSLFAEASIPLGDIPWKRDRAIDISVRWDSSVAFVDMSAGSAHDIGTHAPLSVDDSALDHIRIGFDDPTAIDEAFDGLIGPISVYDTPVT